MIVDKLEVLAHMSLASLARTLIVVCSRSGRGQIIQGPHPDSLVTYPGMVYEYTAFDLPLSCRLCGEKMFEARYHLFVRL